MLYPLSYGGRGVAAEQVLGGSALRDCRPAPLYQLAGAQQQPRVSQGFRDPGPSSSARDCAPSAVAEVRVRLRLRVARGFHPSTLA